MLPDNVSAQVVGCQKHGTPSKWHYLAAENSPMRIFLVCSVTAGAMLAAYLCFPVISTGNLVEGIVLVFSMMFFGAGAGFLWFFMTAHALGPTYHLLAKFNGGPFSAGDTVRVIRKRHRGRTGRISQVFDERFSVQIDFGSAEKLNNEEFSFTDVFKVGETFKQNC